MTPAIAAFCMMFAPCPYSEGSGRRVFGAREVMQISRLNLDRTARSRGGDQLSGSQIPDVSRPGDGTCAEELGRRWRSRPTTPRRPAMRTIRLEGSGTGASVVNAMLSIPVPTSPRLKVTEAERIGE